MKFIRETFSYLKKSFWLLVLICLVPAGVLGIFVKPLSSMTFVPQYSKTFVRSFADVFALIFNVKNLRTVYPLILIFVTILIAICMCVSVIEKHFRVGKLMLKKPFSEINSTFFPVLSVELTLSAVMIVYSILLISLVSFLQYMICGFGTYPTVGAVIAAAVISIVLFIVGFCTAGPFMLMIPIMVIYGYSFSDALTSAFELAGKKSASVLFGGIFPFLVVLIIEYILSFFEIIKVVSVIVSTLMYLFLLVYIVAYVMIVMFELSGLERRDNKKFHR